MGKPFSAMLRARFCPITARPARPMRDRAGEASMAEERERERERARFSKREREVGGGEGSEFRDGGWGR